MNLIVAADKNWAIGNRGRLLVTIPEDQKLFRQDHGEPAGRPGPSGTYQCGPHKEQGL